MSCSSKRVSESSCENGSSSSRNRGSTASARASETHCCVPSDSLRRQLVGRVGDAHELEVVARAVAAISRALLRRSALRGGELDVLLAPSATGSRHGDWNTIARSGPGPDRLRVPSMTTPPKVARSRPATIDSTVDLPQPEWPRMATNSPASNRRVDVLDGDERTGRRREHLGQARSAPAEYSSAPPRRSAEATGGARCCASTAGRSRSRPQRCGQRRDDVCARRACRLLVVRELRDAARPRQLHGESARRASPAGRATIGTMRSDSRIASSTLLVIMTVVTGRSAVRAHESRPAPAAASRASARRARRTARRGTAPAGRSRTRVRWRRAAACRPRAGAAGD